MKVDMSFTCRMLLLAGGLLFGATGIAPADEGQKRIAFSERLGIEVLAHLNVGEDAWCSRHVILDVKAQGIDFFKSESFEELAPNLGRIVANECPRTMEATINGMIGKDMELVYRGGMQKTSQWELIPLSLETQSVASNEIPVPPPPPESAPITTEIESSDAPSPPALSDLPSTTKATTNIATVENEDITDCDRFAAHPNDPNKVAGGMDWDDLNPEKAIPACELAVSNSPDDPRLVYQLGRSLDKAERQGEAIEWYRKSANQNYSAAQYILGRLHSKGEGVVQDDVESTVWYRKAAEQGHIYGEYYLGIAYSKGKGLPQNSVEAAIWFLKAAEQGDDDAQAALGWAYHRGEGVPQDYATAANWYLKSAEQGNAFAQSNLGSLYQSGQGVPQDDSEAVSLFRKAAEQGHANGQFNLGLMYDNGNGVPQDYAKAAEWYATAAEQDVARAQNNLGNLFYNGNGVQKDREKAIFWWNKAAVLGNENSKDSLYRTRNDGKYRCECTYGGMGDSAGRFCGVEVKRRDEITSTYWTESYFGSPDEIWSCSEI